MIDANQTSFTVQVTRPDASVHDSTDQSHVTLDNVLHAQQPEDSAAGDVAETRNHEAAKGVPTVVHPNAASESSDLTREVGVADADIVGEPGASNLTGATNGDEASDRHHGKRIGVSHEVSKTPVTGVDQA